MLAQQGLQHRGTGTFSKFERKTRASPRSCPPEDSSCAWLELPGWWSGEPGSGEQQTKPNGPGRFKCAGESAGSFFRSLRAYPFTLCHQTAHHPLGAARCAGVAGRRGREPSRRPRCPTGGGSRDGRVPQGPGIRGPGGRAPFGSTSVGADGAGRNPTLAACGRERGRRCAGGGGAAERLPHPEGTPPPRAAGSPPGPAWLGPPVAEAVQAEGCRRPGAGRGRGAALSPSRGSGARRESRRWAPVCLRAGRSHAERREGEGGCGLGRPAAPAVAVPADGAALQPGHPAPAALPRGQWDPLRVLGSPAWPRRGEMVSPRLGRPCGGPVPPVAPSPGSAGRGASRCRLCPRRLVVGAPRASWPANVSVANPGAIFRCRIGRNPRGRCDQLQLGESAAGRGRGDPGAGVGGRAVPDGGGRGRDAPCPPSANRGSAAFRAAGGFSWVLARLNWRLPLAEGRDQRDCRRAAMVRPPPPPPPLFSCKQKEMHQKLI